jgi:hypothetical protein
MSGKKAPANPNSITPNAPPNTHTDSSTLQPLLVEFRKL